MFLYSESKSGGINSIRHGPPGETHFPRLLSPPGSARDQYWPYPAVFHHARRRSRTCDRSPIEPSRQCSEAHPPATKCRALRTHLIHRGIPTRLDSSRRLGEIPSKQAATSRYLPPQKTPVVRRGKERQKSGSDLQRYDRLPPASASGLQAAERKPLERACRLPGPSTYAGTTSEGSGFLWSRRS